MSFNGSLISMGGDVFPLSYVFKESYNITPNMRQDIDSTRNADGTLSRNVLPHTVTDITFETRPMNNTMMAKMMSFIRSHYVNELEKKVQLTYYCPDLDDYKTDYFYVPDVIYNILWVHDDEIMYGSCTLEFIGY